MAAGRTYTPIATTTLSSAAASVTFSSISNSYTDLVLVASNVTASVSSNNIYIRFNSDTGTNYSYTILTGNGSITTSARVSNANYNFFGGYNVGVDSTFPSIMTASIQNYSNATTNKTSLVRFGINASSTGETQAVVNLWRSTAAINTILIYPFTGNFLPGSTFTLYGIAAA